MGKKVLVIGDAHMPWTNMSSLNAIYLAIAKERPDAIVQIGDLYDLYSFSRFARTHDLCTPKAEIEEGRQMAESFWKNVRQFAPGAECYQIKGNHDSRIIARAEEKYPEILALLNIDHLWKFPGVTTIDDVRDELCIDGVLYIHGYLSKLGAHMNHFMEPVVRGHDHKLGVVFRQLRTKLIWEMTVGFIGDKKAVPLSYTKTKTNGYMQGYGIVNDGCPIAVPLPG